MPITSMESTLPPPMSISLGPPREAALQTMMTDANLLTQLGKIGGRKNRKYKRSNKIIGGGNDIIVPVLSPIYRDNAAGGQDIVSTTIQVASNSNQSNANAVYDKYASSVIPVPSSQFQKGGTYIVQQGQPWPSCYSGGKKTYKKRRGKKVKKTKKSRKRKTIRRQ